MTFEHISLEGEFVVTVSRDDGFHNDEILENLAPMIFKTGGHTQKSTNPADILEDVHSANYIEARKSLTSAMGWTQGDIIEFFDDQQGYDASYNGSELGDLLMDRITDELSMEKGNLDLIEEVAQTLGVICYRFTGRGYCQGDYIEAIAYVSQDWISQQYGETPPNTETLLKRLEQDAETYTAWAFGDVYDVQLHALPDNFNSFMLEEEFDEDDIEDALETFDPDWALHPIDGITIVEQLPDFDSHEDITAMVHNYRKLAA